MKYSHKLTDEQKINIVKEYTENITTDCSSIAKKYNVFPNSINGILRRRGIEIRNNKSILSKKYKYDNSYFDIIDSEDKAYFLGFLYADGYNNVERGVVTISIVEKDSDILFRLREKLKTDKPIRFIKKRKESHQNQVQLYINGKYFSEKLAELGCVQNKSLILKFPSERQVPNHLLRHFIRGYMDGDGCICYSENGKRIYDCVIIVSTKNFCKTLKKILLKEKNVLSCINKPTGIKNNVTVRLSITSKQSLCEFLKWIYEDATIFLQRKYEKYIKIKNR